MYGVSSGFQYKGMKNDALEQIGSDLVESNCFYSLYGVNDSIDQLISDVNNFIDPVGEVKWMNAALYNPIQIFNNVAVGYEFCDVYLQFERLSGLLSGDWALLADTLVQDGVYLGMDGIWAVGNITAELCHTEISINETTTKGAVAAIETGVI